MSPKTNIISINKICFYVSAIIISITECDMGISFNVFDHVNSYQIFKIHKILRMAR